MEKLIIFDFDGVIIDSFSLAYEINRRTIPTLTEEEYRRRFEGNINATMKAYNFNTDREKEYFKEYGECLNLRKLVPGMKEAVSTLSKKYPMVIVSSTTTEIIQKYLFCHQLEACFANILGNDVDHSKVEKFKIVFEKFDISPEKCLFITDTLGDIKEAAEVLLPTLAVTWGFHTRSTLEKGKTLALINSPEDLLKKIEEYFDKK